MGGRSLTFTSGCGHSPSACCRTAGPWTSALWKAASSVVLALAAAQQPLQRRAVVVGTGPSGW